MNKNWLYRVLAIALVAMLALPMFALAEEVVEEVEAVLGAEGSVVEDVVLGNDGAVEDNAVEISIDYDDDDVYNFDFDSKEYEIEDAFNYDETQGFIINVDDIGDYDVVASMSFKSNKTKVASVGYVGVLPGYSYGAGVVEFNGTGKCTITVKAKLGKIGHNHIKYKTKSFKVKFTVVDTHVVDTVKTYYGEYDSFDKDDTKKTGHSYGSVLMGKGLDEDGETLADDAKVLIPVAFDANGDVNSYIADPDTFPGKTWKWSWSNANVAFFRPDGAGLVNKMKQKSGYWYEDYTINQGETLFPIFYKAGKSTVTFKSMNNKKATAKFTVSKKVKSWTVKKSDGDPDAIVVKVKKVDFTDMDHATVTLVAINNTGNTYKAKTLPFIIKTRIKGEEVDVFGGEKKFDVTVKPGKMVTFTMKFSTKRSSDFSIEDSTILNWTSDIATWAQPWVTFEDEWLPEESAPAYGKDVK